MDIGWRLPSRTSERPAVEQAAFGDGQSAAGGEKRERNRDNAAERTEREVEDRPDDRVGGRGSYRVGQVAPRGNRR